MTIAHDFSDWLSPMLVKELRQGMRSKALITSLFLLQSLLILNAIVGLGAAAKDDLTGTTVLFWVIIGLPLLVILPSSALGGIGNEIKANTLDLVFLTRLTARRIVLGKWIAILAQSALLALTALPYIALRYYLGGVNITADLTTAGLIIVASAMISALTVALSSYPAKSVRILFGVAFFFSIQFLGVFGVASSMGGRRVIFTGLGDWPAVAALLLLVPLFVLLMIEVGAIRIAPAAENHSGMCRLLALLVVLTTGAAAALAPRAGWLLVVGQVIATPFCIAALCEVPPSVPGVFRPLVRRGRIGSLLTRVFSPGWHTGVLYVLLIGLLLAFFYQQAGWLRARGDGLPALRHQLSLAGFEVSLLLPAILAPALSRKRVYYFVGLFGFCLVVFILALMLGATDRYAKDEMINLLTFLPPVAVFASALTSQNAVPQLAWTTFLGLLALGIYLFKSREAWRQSHALRKVARQQVAQKLEHAA